MSDIILRKIDATNYADAMKLKVADNQKNFVASNEKSLIQAAYLRPGVSTPYGIYDGETMVGFLLGTPDDDHPDVYWIWRIMVDANQQKKGYGRAAIQKLIVDLREEYKYRTLRLSYMPDNEVAKKIYKKLGFVEQGMDEEQGIEMVANYDLST